MDDLQPWSVRAINLPEHADNVVHTDAGAIAAGYPRALVAGTTVYAYLSHVPAAGWGAEWLGTGGAEVRFRAPVYDDDLVEVVPVTGEDGVVVEARVAGDTRATLAVWPKAPVSSEPSVDGGIGEELPDMVFTIGD
ncbi:MAG: hypothetical protein HKN26_07330, partial [Acidimicrobiales bacterium]|nr:hypothetical protein [Acidimicrobiales bacterium]